MSIQDSLAAMSQAFAGVGTSFKGELQNKGKKALSLSPYRQVGDLNLIPFDITATFEGAEDLYITRHAIMNVEDDGSLYYLRTGTDGSTGGVYVGYVNNILTGAIQKANRSSKKYTPSFLQPNSYVRWIHSCEEGLIAGLMASLTDNSNVCGFIAFVDGSLTAPQQRAVLVNDWTNYFNSRTEFINGNDDYFYAITPYFGSKVGVTIYRIPKAGASVAGTFVVPETIPGWTYDGFRKSASTTTPEFFDVVTSTNVGDNPMVLANDLSGIIGNAAFAGMFTHASYDGPTTGTGGKIRVRMSSDSYFAIPAANWSIRPFLCFSFVMDLVTKVITLDPSTNIANFASLNKVGNTVTAGGSAYSRTMNQIFPMTTANSYNSLIYHKATRQWIMYSDDSTPGTSKRISRGKTNQAWATRYEALQITTVPTDVVYGVNYPNYPSAVGGSFLGAVPLPNNYQLSSCIGRNDAGGTQRGYVRIKRGAYGYNYQSLNSPGGRIGYAPTLERDFVTDLGHNDSDYVGIISHVSGSTVKCNMHSFIQGWKDWGRGSITENLLHAGAAYGCDPAIYNSVKSAVFAAKGISEATILSSLCTIYILDQAELGLDKPLDFLGIAVVEYWITGNVARFMIAHITAFNRDAGGNYTSMTIDPSTVSPPSTAITSVVGLYYGLDFMAMHGSLIIYTPDDKDGIVIAGGSKAIVNYVGNSGGWQFAFSCLSSGGKYQKSTWSTFSTPITNFTYSYSAPFANERGFGYINQFSGLAASDAGTKMNFFPICKTNIAQWATGASLDSGAVLAGQFVSGSYNVFISQFMPILSDGIKVSVPPVSFNIADYYTTTGATTYRLYLSNRPSTVNPQPTDVMKQVTFGAEYNYWLRNGNVMPSEKGTIAVADVTADATSITGISTFKEAQVSYTNKSGVFVSITPKSLIIERG